MSPPFTVRLRPPRFSQCSSGQHSRICSILNCDLSVHDYKLHSHSLDLWLLVGRSIRNSFRIEDNHIGAVAFTNQATFRNPKRLSGECTTVVYKERQRDDLVLQDILTQLLREGAVLARVSGGTI